MIIESKHDLLSLIHSNKNKSGFYSTEKCWKKYFTEFYNELQTWKFPVDFKFTQKIYHYLNDDTELKLGICPECGKRCTFKKVTVGYCIYCSINCKNKSKLVLEKIRQTCLEKYGCENPFQSEEIKEKIYNTNIKKYGKKSYTQTKEYLEKSKTTCLEKYGCENVFQTDEVKDKIQITLLNKYGVDNPSKSKEIKEKKKLTTNKNYGVDCYFQSIEYNEKYKTNEYIQKTLNKIYNTKKKNNSFNTSKIEKQLEQYLLDNNIIYEHQYTSEKYPFSCDFYFPEKDLYVEIQGSWTHGPHPFTNSDDDLELLEKWKSKNTKYYNNAIETWTVRDVKKREIAKINKLNYLEIFSIDFNFCLNKIKELL